MSSKMSDVAHEKAALDAYMATQFNTVYTAAPKTYQDRAFSLPFFSTAQKDLFSKTKGMYRSVRSSPEIGNYLSSTSSAVYDSSRPTYAPSGSGYSCSGGGCYK